MKNQILKHKNICLYGLGSTLVSIAGKLEQLFPIQFITDSNYQKLKSISTAISKVSPEDLGSIEDLFVIVTTSFPNYLVIKKFLDSRGIPNCISNQILELQCAYPIANLSTIDSSYRDHLGNAIEIGPYSKFAPSSFVFFGKEGSGFQSKNNSLEIEFGCSGDSNGSALLDVSFLRENSNIFIGHKAWIKNLRVTLDQENNFDRK